MSRRQLRATLLPLALAAAAVAGCVHPVRFLPASAAFAVAEQPDAATAVRDGVRLVVHVGGWRGAPDDLDDRVTPVEVWVENDSGRPLRIGPEQFTVLAPHGFRYQALEPQEVQRLAAPAYGSGVVVYPGYYGAYPWPGGWGPWHHPGVYPWAWWGWGGPPVVYYQPPAATPPPPTPRGTLESGGSISLLLFFPVPARSLGALEVVADLADDRGQPVTTIRVPLVREGAAPAPPSPAPAPPATPPATPPPPPPEPPPAPPPAPDAR
jgi:hypothetical protein